MKPFYGSSFHLRYILLSQAGARASARAGGAGTGASDAHAVEYPSSSSSVSCTDSSTPCTNRRLVERGLRGFNPI